MDPWVARAAEFVKAHKQEQLEGDHHQRVHRRRAKKTARQRNYRFERRARKVIMEAEATGNGEDGAVEAVTAYLGQRDGNRTARLIDQ